MSSDNSLAIPPMAVLFDRDGTVVRELAAEGIAAAVTCPVLGWWIQLIVATP